MNIRQAILSAADSIEEKTTAYHFFSTNLGGECGSPACALGWIAYHLGYPRTCGQIAQVLVLDMVAQNIVDGGKMDRDFYRAMEVALHEETGTFALWPPRKVVRGLRAYADIHYPEQDYIPAITRAIFTEQVAA